MKNLTFPVKASGISSFTFSVDQNLQSVLIDSFTQWFDSIITQTPSFTDGLEFQYGWSLVKCTITDSILSLQVPDGKSFPIQWSDNVTPALEAIVYHQFVPESFGLDSDIPCLSDTVLVGDRFHELPMFLTRSEKSGDADRHSGWFMASSADDANITEEENLKIMSVYEAIIKAPHILHYISMPVGSQVVFDNAAPSCMYKNKELKPVENSLVATEQTLAGA